MVATNYETHIGPLHSTKLSYTSLSTLFSQKYEKMKTAVSNVITDFQYLVTEFFEKYSDSMYGSLNIFRDGNYHWLSHMLLLRIDIKDKQQKKLSFYILQSSERYDEWISVCHDESTNKNRRCDSYKSLKNGTLQWYEIWCIQWHEDKGRTSTTKIQNFLLFIINFFWISI